VTDQTSGSGISGKTVTFTFQGQPQTAVTDGLGKAATSYFSPSSSGAYTLTAGLPADATYESTSTAAQVTVQQRPTGLSVEPVSTLTSKLFTATATLTDTTTGGPVSGKSVSFTFQGVVQTGVTDASGKAVTSYTSPASSGSYALSASFAGDAAYAAASGSATASVEPRPTGIAADAVNGEPDVAGHLDHLVWARRSRSQPRNALTVVTEYQKLIVNTLTLALRPRGD